MDNENPVIEKEKKLKTWHKAVIFAVAAAAAAVAVFFGVCSHYTKVFLNHSFINEMDVSGMTPEQANEMLTGVQPEYFLNLHFRDGSIEQINGESFGYGYDALDAIEELLTDQVPSDWIHTLSKDAPVYSYSVEVKSSYSEDELKTRLEALPEFVNTEEDLPADARIQLKDTEFEIVPGDPGNWLEPEPVEAAAVEKVDRFEHDLYVEDIEGAYMEPKISADDAALVKQEEELNHSLDASVTYLLSDHEVVLDAQRMVNWLSQDSEGNYYKDDSVWDENLRGFLAELAAEVDQDPDVGIFDGTGVGTYRIEGGSYPRSLNVEKEYEALKEELGSGENITRNPILNTAAGNSENHGIGNTYVEIDVSRQHLWAYDNGNLLLETDIVTGTATHERYTPEGVYYVFFKTEDTFLRGAQRPDGSYEYEVHVDYWMPFNEDIGMHDADWQYYFGGDYYLWGGSRGCINMPVDMAPIMYEWVNSEVPIVCYYSEDPVFID